MPRAKLIIFVGFLLAFPLAVFSQNLEETHSTIRNSVKQKDFSTAINRLLDLQKSNANIFTANNYDYLLARLSERQNDFGTAAANYQSVIDRDSILKEYALWHLSQIMRSTGNLMMERIYLLELSMSSGGKSLLADATGKRIAKSHLESGNYSDAIGILSGQTSIIHRPNKASKTIVEKVKETLPSFGKDISREDLVLLAEAYSQNEQTEKAREIYNELVNNLPKKTQPDDFALAGVKGLDLLEVGEKGFGKTAPSLSDEEHLKRAKIYQFNRNFSFARIHFEAIIKNHPTSDKVPVSLYQIARGFGQERNYEKIVEWSEKLQKDFPQNKLAAAALYQTAGAYANLNNTNEAVKRYVKYIDENPKAKNLERAFLNIIDAYRDEGNPKTALEWTAKTQQRFEGEMGEAVALFSQVRIHISQENWQNALNGLNRLKDMKNLGGIRIAGGTNKIEVTFLRGFVLEKLKRIDDAIGVYNSFEVDYKNYYSWRAIERSRELSKNKDSGSVKRSIKTAPQNIPIPNGRIVKLDTARLSRPMPDGSKHGFVAQALLKLELYDEATPELETSLGQNDHNGFTLAVFYKRGDMANRAISFIEPLWKKVPRDYPIEQIPREHLELLYPKPFEEALVRYGKEYNVDPRFVLSIMRQESRFQANVKSVAAARGLMQFISTTSNQMAKEMKINNFKQNDLYNPPTAIRFGSHYLNKIFKDFPNQPPAVAASYNAGEDRMMRWLRRSKTDDPDRYVPEVIFSQTKDYVYKVMTNYRIYKMLYDENLNNRTGT